MSLNFKVILKKQIKNEQETSDFAREVAAFLKMNSLLLLSGDLGAGKTATVRYLCEHFGISHVQSPTYAIHQRYATKEKVIDHFDLYRLQSEEELVSASFWDLLQATDSLIIVEWFERIPTADWLEFEKDRREIFGIKIQLDPANENRMFQFFELQKD